MNADEFPFDPTRPEDLRAGANFPLEMRLGDLDVMQWIAGIDADPAYGALAAAAIQGELDGIPLRVCGLDHLIAMKRAAGRRRDLDDLQRLGAASPARMVEAKPFATLSLNWHSARLSRNAPAGTLRLMPALHKHREIEAHFRQLVDEAALPEPDDVEYEPDSVIFYWHQPKVAIFVDLDRRKPTSLDDLDPAYRSSVREPPSRPPLDSNQRPTD
ncbi:MAG: hypothetical protein ACRDK0_12040 [Solirubrobacteraceae bacterium]